MSSKQNRGRDPEKRAAKRAAQRAAGYRGVQKGGRAKLENHASSPRAQRKVRDGERKHYSE